MGVHRLRVTWRHLVISAVVLASESWASTFRDGRAITWADILKGKPGYPSVSVQGSVDSLSSLEVALPTAISFTTTATTLPTPFSTESIRKVQSPNTQSNQFIEKPTRQDFNNIAKTGVHNPSTEEVHETPNIVYSNTPTIYSNNYNSDSVSNEQKNPTIENTKNLISQRNILFPPPKYSEYVPAHISEMNWESTQVSEPVIIPAYNSVVNDLDNSVDYKKDQSRYNYYDYNYDDDTYDDSFFDNNYYEYVDTDDNGNNIKNVSEETPDVQVNNTDGVSQTADRRALDFLYHMFLDPSRHSKKDRRPSLIEEVFGTIDRHIVEDVQAWTDGGGNSQNILNSFFQLPSAKPGKKTPQVYLPPIVNAGSAPSLPLQEYFQPTNPQVQSFSKPVQAKLPQKGTSGLESISQGYLPPTTNNISPNFAGDKFLVSDETGEQYLVSIDDIITSLAQLDEQQVTNLLLGDPTPPALPRTDSIISPQNLLQLAGNVERPTRQINNDVVDNENEVFLIKDRDGTVQIVTMNDILQSLSKYNKNEVIGVLSDSSSHSDIKKEQVHSNVNNLGGFAQETEQHASNWQNVDLSSLLLEQQNSKPKVISKTVSSDPIISINEDGNIAVSLPKSGTSSKIDLRDNHLRFESPPKLQPRVVGKSVVKTDEKGNIHIFPNPNEPFNLDIKNIIDLAEKANPVYKSDIRKITTTTTTTEPPSPGVDILEFLIGGAGNLPRPIRSSKASYFGEEYGQSAPKESKVLSQLLAPHISPSNGNAANHGDYSLNSVLKSAQQQNRNANFISSAQDQSAIYNQLPRPIVTKPTQYIQQYTPVTDQSPSQAQSPSLTSSLTNLFSRIIGNGPTVLNSAIDQSSAQQIQANKQNEFVRLVVRQQDKGPNEQIFGHVNIELPRAIHYQDTTPRPAFTNAPDYESRNSNRRVLHIRDNIPRNSQQARNRGRDMETEDIQVKTPQEIPRTQESLVSTLNQARIPNGVQKFLLAQMNNKPKFKLSNLIKSSPDQAKSRSYNTQHSSDYTYVYHEPSVQSYIPPNVQQPAPSYPSQQSYQSNDGPLFGIDFLADLVKVEKIGKHNKSVFLPKIGDSSQFVNTRHHHYHR